MSVSSIIDQTSGLDYDAPKHFGLLVQALQFPEVRAVACRFARATPAGLDAADSLLRHVFKTSGGMLGVFRPCNSTDCLPNGHDTAWWQVVVYTVRRNLYTLLEEKGQAPDGRWVKLPGFDQVRRNLALQLAYKLGAPMADRGLHRELRREMLDLREWMAANTPTQTKAGLVVLAN
jgi:hypothetical protein